MKEEDDDDFTDDYKITKLFWTITELAEMFDVTASLLRLWERQFEILKPRRINSRGDRKYSKEDIEHFKLIYHLVREKGYSIPGAQAKLKELKNDSVNNEQIVLTLRAVREFLIELRANI
jgi:DNA-binding transcriptional MerR regulator